jgi:hypothetical protein
MVGNLGFKEFKIIFEYLLIYYFSSGVRNGLNTSFILVYCFLVSETYYKIVTIPIFFK